MADQALTDARITGLLQTLASADPDFTAFAQEQPLLGQQRLSEEAAGGLSRELLAVLRESPQQATQIDALLQGPHPERFDSGLVSVPVLVAVTFLLRSHFRFKRHTDGKWAFQIEHKPADSQLLTQLLKKLASLLPGAPADAVDP